MAIRGEWSFNEGTGTSALDTSGNNYIASNVPGWSGSGHTSASMQSSGSVNGAQVTLPASYDFTASGGVNEENITRSTFMCWFRLNSLKADQQIIRGPRYGGAGEWTVAVTSSGVLFSTGQGTITTSATLSVNTWYHVAIAVDWSYGGGPPNSNTKLYLNGSLVGSGEGFPLHNWSPLYWGGLSVPLDGRIDDARWDSTQLGATAITTLMNTSVGGTAPGPTAKRWWKSDDGTWVPMSTQLTIGSPPIIIDPEPGLLKGWELTKANTGLNKHGITGPNLPLYTGSEKPAAGTTITERRITTGLDVSNGNITLERCYIAPAAGSTGSVIMGFDNNSVSPGKGPVTIRDCTITGINLTQQQSAFSLGIQAYGTFTGNLITNLGSGIGVMGVGLVHDSYIEGNYVTGLTAYGDPAGSGNHSDAFTIRDYSNASNPSRKIDVINNRFDCDSGNDSGACFLQTYADNIDNATIRDNMLEGGAWLFWINSMNGNNYTNIQVINNRFRVTSGYPAGAAGDGSPIATWQDNHHYAVGQPDFKGAIVSSPS